MLGMHGTVAANYAVHECDLLVAVGARFDDRVTGKLSAFAPQAKIIHIDIDPAEIGKNVQPMIPIVGDARNVLARLMPRRSRRWSVSHERTAAWRCEVRRVGAQFAFGYEHEAGTLAPQFVIEEIDRVTEATPSWSPTSASTRCGPRQYYHYQWPRQFISSGGLGTMGFGLPAAIGAKVGRPDKTVIDISGDGGFQMTMQELTTAV